MKTNALFAAVLLAAYAFALPLDAAALSLTRGPYLQLGTQSSIVVRWRTETATDSRVRYGTTPSNLSSVVDDSTSATEHLVKLTGLNPSTKYYYSVGHSEATLAGGTDHFFVAAPPPGTEQTTNIWVLGTSGIANAQARAVHDAYLKYKGNQYTHLWLMLGDNAYHNRTDSDYQDALFNTYPTLLRQTTLWPALGDGVTADSAPQSGAYYDIFTLPKQGEAGGLASGTEAYYSFEYSNIHFVVLDSVESSKASSGAMLTWLENDLAVTTQPWIIAYWDHPPCSKGFHDSDTETALREMRENVLPILEDASVDLVLNGDCGSYERSFSIDGHSGSSVTFEPQTMLVDGSDGSIEGNGEYQTSVIDRPIRDAVVGSSGETQVGSLDYPVIYVSLKTLGSMALNVNGPSLDAVFLDDTGQVRDRFRMVKTTDTAKASTSAPDVPTTEVNPTSQTVTVNPAGGTVGGAAGNISSGSSIVGATTRSVSSSSNLVAHWTLDTQNVDPSQSSAEVRDVSGYNNHADLKNHSGTTVPGKLGQALSLDGVDDYAEKIAFSGLPSSAITVSAWIKLDAHKNWNRVLNHEWVNNGWLLFTDASGTATFGVGQSGVQYNAIKAGLTVGSWYHLVGVYDGSNVRIYVNGQQGTPRAKSGLILDSGGNVDIGGAQGDRFRGAIDDVRIYDKALTASDVAALYNPEGTNNLVAHWTLDTQNVDASQSGAEVRDVSGYNNHADLKNHSATTVPGKLGQALSFDGVDDYAETIAFSGLPSSAITVSAWIKLDAHKNWNRVLNHEWVNNGWLLFTDASGTATFGVGQSGVQYNAIKTGLTVGSWYHLVGVYDGSNVRIYVNGQEGTPRATSGLILDSSGNVDIGGAERDRFKGAIDDVRIYNKVLTASEVQALYNVGGTTDTFPPSPPTNLTANAVSSSQINLSWNVSTDNVGVTGYKVYRGAAQIATTTGTTYSNSGLSPSITYSYTVAAYDAAGNTSAQSTVVSATTQTASDTTAPSAPPNLTASAVSSSQINLSWNASTDNVGVTGYKVYRGGAQIATITGTSYSNTGLSPSITYSYTVAAYDAAGNTSAQSTVVSATTQAAPDTTAPSAPPNLTASAVSSSQINLSWNASTDNIGVVGYRVERCQGSGCASFVQIATPTGMSYQNTGLSANTPYQYRVRATDAAGNLSGYSSIASVTTQSGPTVPGGFVVGIHAQAFLSWGTTQKQLLKDSRAHSVRVGRHGDLVNDDDSIRFAAQNGMSVLLMAGYNRTGGNIVTDPAARQKYADMALADVQKFGSVIKEVEVWNEWNGGFGLSCTWGQAGTPCTNPALYTDLLCKVYNTIKPVRPDIKIVGGGMAGYDPTFARGMFDAGAANCMDLLSFHPYAQSYPRHAPWSGYTPQTLADEFIWQVNDMNAVIKSKTSKNIPIAVTEEGYSDSESTDATIRQYAADYLTAVYTKAKTNPIIYGIWWYDFPSVGGSGQQNGYGLLDTSLNRKPAYYAFQNVATTFMK